MFPIDGISMISRSQPGEISFSILRMNRVPRGLQSSSATSENTSFIKQLKTKVSLSIVQRVILGRPYIHMILC